MERSYRVEYTDVFGRCRKIARKDFHKVKEQDDEMSNVVETREEQTDPNKDASDSSRSVGELSEDSDDSIVGPDIGLQFLKQRENWSKQEELNKERTSTHYQDVLFDGELTRSECYKTFILLIISTHRHCLSSSSSNTT